MLWMSGASKDWGRCTVVLQTMPSSWAGLWAAVDSPPETDTKLYDVLGIAKEASVADIKKVPHRGGRRQLGRALGSMHHDRMRAYKTIRSYKYVEVILSLFMSVYNVYNYKLF